MPSRRDIFVNRSYYHIYSKTIDNKNIFLNRQIARYFLNALAYYRSKKAHLRYSMFRRLKKQDKERYSHLVNNAQFFYINIIVYCLMPNHFHLLIRQKIDEGIIRTVATTLDSITRYYNIKKQRKGPIFLTPFRSRRILSREDFLHVSRYIHLNPYSAGLIAEIEHLTKYRFNSFRNYVLSMKKDIIDRPDLILKKFGGNSEKYKQFVLDHADYQKSLERIKYTKKWI